jgi:hypothetical protein
VHNQAVGKFSYGKDAEFVVEDRALVHLRLIHMTKMRRGEGFALQLPDPNLVGTRSLWLGPSVAVAFRFVGHEQHPINGRWIDEMMHDANGPNGLTLGPEPARAEH